MFLNPKSEKFSKIKEDQKFENRASNYIIRELNIDLRDKFYNYAKIATHSQIANAYICKLYIDIHIIWYFH